MESIPEVQQDAGCCISTVAQERVRGSTYVVVGDVDLLDFGHLDGVGGVRGVRATVLRVSRKGRKAEARRQKKCGWKSPEEKEKKRKEEGCQNRDHHVTPPARLDRSFFSQLPRARLRDTQNAPPTWCTCIGIRRWLRKHVMPFQRSVRCRCTKEALSAVTAPRKRCNAALERGF